MKKEWLVKTLALCVVVLFISVSYQPIIAENTLSAVKETDYNNVDFEQAKEYLFQTLVDISNNPKVKQFLNEHKHSLIPRNNSNYDCKNAIQEIYSQNPKLLKSIIFTKPKTTFEYLEKNYNKGLEIVDILGEEESLEIVNSVKITNPELFNDLQNIILNDEELSIKISNLKKMNNNIKSNLDLWAFPIICGILYICELPVAAFFAFFLYLLGLSFFYLPYHYPLIKIFFVIDLIFLCIIFPFVLIYCTIFSDLLLLFGCEEYK